MAFLVRKIDMSYWNVEAQPTPVNADAITKCLRTSGNTLSVWRVNSKEEISEALLAIAASQHHLRKIDIVVLDEIKLLEKEISIVEVLGESPCTDLNPKHRDLSNLNINSLDVISEAVAAEIRAKENIHCFTIVKLKALLEGAVGQGRIIPENLALDVRKKLSIPQPAQ